MTSPHANMIGDYHCPVAYISIDTGLTLEGASKALRRVCDGVFAHYDASTDTTEAAVLEQLTSWFGAQVSAWHHLRTYRIAYALPRQAAPALAVPERDVRRGPGLYVCGDHVDNASINGAMVSGRRAAQAVIG